MDIKQQIVTTSHRFTLFDKNQNKLEVRNSAWKTRYLYKQQYLDLFDNCGLVPENIVGTYNNEPVSLKGQLIFQLKLK